MNYVEAMTFKKLEQRYNELHEQYEGTTMTLEAERAQVLTRLASVRQLKLAAAARGRRVLRLGAASGSRARSWRHARMLRESNPQEVAPQRDRVH